MTRLLALSLAFSLAVAAACGGAERPTIVIADAGTEEGADAALPPGVDHYHGNVACCAQGAGRCCGANELCEEYVACVQTGESWEPKGLACQDCCPGLTALEIVTQNADGTCTPSGEGFEPNFVCGACGDGLCDTANRENHCNCPADCP